MFEPSGPHPSGLSLHFRSAIQASDKSRQAPTPEDFFLVKADGGVDGTHFQENGARKLAGFVADGVREAKLPLARYLE
jgi:hypothetical protein